MSQTNLANSLNNINYDLVWQSDLHWEHSHKHGVWSWYITIHGTWLFLSVQNFAARIITGTRKFDHITPALRDLRWLRVKQRLFFCDAVMAFKCMTGEAPHYLSDQFTTRFAVTRHVTRSCQLINIPLYKSNTRQRTFCYHTVYIWNNLDSSLKTAKSIWFLLLNLPEK